MAWHTRMSTWGLILTLTSISLGQQETDVNAKVAHLLISHILLKYRISGSLEYSGNCDLQRPQPHLPDLRVVLNNVGAGPVRELGAMFAQNRTMHVSQDRDRTIRMVETDVARDLLEVRISHIAFNDSRDRGEVLEAILRAPEVQSFMSAHKIRQAMSPSVAAAMGRRTPDTPHLSGDLDNVSLSQALDYGLKTYPGYWVYENCPKEDGGRMVFFQFF